MRESPIEMFAWAGWILLAFCFTERNKTYAHTFNEASLPQEGYEDRTLSANTINRWYDSFSDVGENRVYFASKILTPCRMH